MKKQITKNVKSVSVMHAGNVAFKDTARFVRGVSAEAVTIIPKKKFGPVRIPLSQIQDVVAAAKQMFRKQGSLNGKAIGRQIGMKPDKVWRIAARKNLDLSGNRLSKERREKIIDRLRLNPNSSAVARELGEAQRTVAYLADKAEIDLKKGRALSKRKVVTRRPGRMKATHILKI